MEQQIKDRYQDSILHEAMARYGIASHRIQPLEAVENFVYEFDRDGEPYILRITHSRRRSEALIQGEIDWITYLATGGVSVSRAAPSLAGRFVEVVADGQDGDFLATAFIKAPGQPPYDLWSPRLCADFGRLLGRMHALAARYEPSRPEWRRPEWNDDMMDVVGRYLPASEEVAQRKYRVLEAYARTLPKGPQSYGLVHFDAHAGNLRVDEGGCLTIFDFDECVYTWYANDIAIALFAAVTNVPDAPAFTQHFMSHFLRGYRTAHTLDKRWLKELPIFLKMAEIFLYAVIHRDFDLDNITHAWCARFMVDRKWKIDHDVPYIDFDFESLSTVLEARPDPGSVGS